MKIFYGLAMKCLCKNLIELQILEFSSVTQEALLMYVNCTYLIRILYIVNQNLHELEVFKCIFNYE